MTLNWRPGFTEGLEYNNFLDQYASAGDRKRWEESRAQVILDELQQRRLESFVREMNVLCLAGTWCGDCVDQAPVFQAFSESNPRIQVRFLDQDDHSEIQDQLSINGGHRIPVLVFLSEDYFEVSRFGERTLSRYRQLAVREGIPLLDEMTVGSEENMRRLIVDEWLNEFERAQLILRLSPRLREKHTD